MRLEAAWTLCGGAPVAIASGAVAGLYPALRYADHSADALQTP